MQKGKFKMQNIKLELIELKTIFNYISESIIVIDNRNNIVLINNTALNKLSITQDNILYTNFNKLILAEEQKEVLEILLNEDNSYHEVFLKKSNNELFTAFISSQPFPLKDDNYQILTIVDVSELKEREKEQLKKLKSHIITQATTHAKKQSDTKGEQQSELIALQEERDLLKHEVFKMEKKISLFERENRFLNNQCEKIQEDSFSFEQVLNREIALSKRYDRKFSLAIVAIDNFKAFTEQVNNEAKKDLILRAFKKHFRSTIRTTDVIYYENSGLFYMILPNSVDVNITDLVDRLLHAKRIDTKIIVRFNCGISHIYVTDTADHLIYRAKKSLEENIKENELARNK
jgi:PAS domain S-box-containing protein